MANEQEVKKGSRIALVKHELATSLGQEIRELVLDVLVDGQITDAEISELAQYLSWRSYSAFPAIEHLIKIVGEAQAKQALDEKAQKELFNGMLRVLPTADRKELKQLLKDKNHEASPDSSGWRGPKYAFWSSLRAGVLGEYDFLLAGSHLEDFQHTYADKLVQGVELQLQREPKNGYDPRAVRVVWEGKNVGYVRREVSWELTDLLKADVRYQAEVARVTERNNGNKQPEIKVTVYRAEAAPEHALNPLPDAEDGRAPTPRSSSGEPGGCLTTIVAMGLTCYALMLAMI